MPFKLPEITYPLSVDTVGKILALGQEIHVCCYNHGCGHNGRLNLVLLARKFGMDYSCAHPALMQATHCPRCREAGRDPKNIGFIRTPLTAEHCEWPRDWEIDRRRVIQGRRE